MRARLPLAAAGPLRWVFILAACAALVQLRAADKTTYDDHVLPILRNSCLKCHNPDKARADLDLSTFKAALAGSGSGPIVKPGEPDNSKLLKVITHQEEPTMPPNGKLGDAEIAAVRRWIEGGLLENTGSKAVTVTKPKLDLNAVASVGKPEGPPPMPGELLLDPLLTTERPGAVTALTASPWAPVAALAGQHQALLYDSDTLELAGILPFPEGVIADLRFSRSGKLLVAGGGRAGKSGLAVAWDIATGERVLTLGEEFDTVLAADLSPDQQWLALGGPGRVVKVFQTSDGTLKYRLKKHTDWVTALEISPDNKLLATGDRNGGLVVWELGSGEELYSLTGHKGAITAVSWRRPEVLLSASEDGSVRIWTMEEGQSVKNWAAHPPGTLCLRSTHDGRLVTCGRDFQVALWKPDGAKQTGLAFTNDLPMRAAFTHDGNRVIAGDWLGNVSVWNATNGNRIGELHLNPPALARQQELARQRLDALRQELATNQNPTAAAELARLAARTNGFPRATSLAAWQRARLDLARLKAELTERQTEVKNADEALKKASAELKAPPKPATASTPAAPAAPVTPAAAAEAKAARSKRLAALKQEIKTQTARRAAAEESVTKLAQEVANLEARLPKLAADYEHWKTAPAPTASTNAPPAATATTAAR